MNADDAWLDQPGLRLDGPEDAEAATAFCRERGWTDGLPVIPPTAERVTRMLAYCDVPWDQPLCSMPPRYGVVTPLRLAANAVMAGCLPEYFPLVRLAVEALCAEPFNLYGLQTTTHPGGPLAIFNGPVAREAGLNSGHGAFGPGCAANATIGRALRLALLNIGGAYPGSTDMATVGTPAKYGFVVAENEAASPWEPLHESRGCPAGSSAVTMVATEGPHNVNDHFSRDGEGVLISMAGAMGSTGPNSQWYDGESVVAFGPEHAGNLGAQGYTREQVQRYLQQNGYTTLGRFSPDNQEGRFRAHLPEKYRYADNATRIHAVRSPDQLLVIVLGGAGKHSAWIPSFGPTRAVTQVLRLADGTPAASLEDFRKNAPAGGRR